MRPPNRRPRARSASPADPSHLDLAPAAAPTAASAPRRCARSPDPGRSHAQSGANPPPRHIGPHQSSRCFGSPSSAHLRTSAQEVRRADPLPAAPAAPRPGRNIVLIDLDAGHRAGGTLEPGGTRLWTSAATGQSIEAGCALTVGVGVVASRLEQLSVARESQRNAAAAP